MPAVSTPRRKKIEQPNGRPLRVVQAPDGKPVMFDEHFLAWHKPSGRFYIGRTKPRQYIGTDLTRAIALFRELEAQVRAQVTHIAYSRTPTPIEKAHPLYKKFVAKHEDKEGRVPTIEDIPLDAYCADLARRLRDPDAAKLLAQGTGIQELAYLPKLRPPAPSMTLSAVGEMYLNKRPPLSEHWRRKATAFWKEFCNRVNARRVSDLTADDIASYHDMVLDNAASPTYAVHRFGHVKSVFNHALTRGKDTDNLQRALTLCKMLVPPKKRGANAEPISRKHFASLLDHAANKWKAVLLLALNAALYPSEVGAVRKTEIDLDAGTLVMDRGKTGVPRVAVLWKRTIDAIRTYQAETLHESEYVFVSQTGAPYDGNHVGRNFRNIRTSAGIPDEVQFAHIRDGAYTAAFNADGVEEKHAKVLAGHRTGMSDAYIKRRPRMVERACTAIEVEYFN